MEAGDPSKKPYDLVQVYEDGAARRNDGIDLRPQSAEAWYVLATAHGEQEGAEIDYKLHAQNLETWNRVMLELLSPDNKKHLVDKYALKHPLNAKSLSNEEKRNLEAQLKKRHREFSLEELKNSDQINFSQILCPNHICLDGFIFLKPVSFARSHFSRDFRIEKAAVLNRSDFKGVTLSGNAYFRASLFVESASFHSARFQSVATFREATFYDEVEFYHAKFMGRTYFESTRFFSSSGCNISPKFNDCVFEFAVSFRQALFRDAVPNMRETLFPNSVEFTPDEKLWPNEKSLYNEESRETFSALSHAMDSRGLKDHAHFFFRREMMCRESIANGLDALLLRAYRYLSNFGYSVVRPLWGLLIVVLLGAITFFVYSLDAACYQNRSVEVKECLTSTFSEAPSFVAISFSNTFAFLGFQRAFFEVNFLRDLPSFLKVVTAAQTLLGIILLFFLGLGLRNRFRLK